MKTIGKLNIRDLEAFVCQALLNEGLEGTLSGGTCAEIYNEDKIRPVRMEFKTGTLSLLSATDCAKDRLVGYYHGNDLQCMEQAVMICTMNDVHIINIEKWSKKEGQLKKHKIFMSRLQEAAKK